MSNGCLYVLGAVPHDDPERAWASVPAACAQLRRGARPAGTSAGGAPASVPRVALRPAHARRTREPAALNDPHVHAT